MPRFTFTPDIQFGHVLQALTMAAGLAIFIVTRANDIALIKHDLDEQRQVQIGLVKELRAISDTQIEMLAWFRSKNPGALPKQNPNGKFGKQNE